MDETTTPPILTPLKTFCQTHDLPWDTRISEHFEQFLELLTRFQNAMNLIGPLNREQIVQELFIDSVAPAVLAPPIGEVADIGSGAGFPGIPLAILYPEANFTLIEPRKKRTSFLQIVKHRLGLTNINIEQARIESIPEGTSFDYIISKAFQPPTTWIQTAQNLAHPASCIVCMITTPHIPPVMHLVHDGPWAASKAFHPHDGEKLGDRAVLVLRMKENRP